MTAVEQAIAEIEKKEGVFGPEYEGLQDYARLNISPETKAEVDAMISLYRTRLDYLFGAKSALATLMTHGHPELNIHSVTLTVYNDLKSNASTIEAALKKFDSNAASALSLSSEPPEPK